MPTTLLRGGRVRTPDHPAATALVVGDDGLVAWLGDEADATRFAGDVARVVVLDGALVLPGFVDAHAHVSRTGLGLRGVDLAGARSVTEALRLVEAAARASRGRPVYAFGWDEHTWPERRPMTARELDRASAGGVVYAARVDSHSAVASSALAAASGAVGLDGWTAGGWVTMDAKNAARVAFDAAISPAQRRADIEAALRRAASVGVVAVHECGGPLLTSGGDFSDVLELGCRPDLPATLGYWAEAVTDPEQARALVALHGAAGLGGDLNVDGSIGSRTACLGTDYADAPGQRGTTYRTAAAVRDHVAACALAGVQSGFHVIGDGGVDLVLEGYTLAAELVGDELVRASRPRLEHVEMVSASGIATMARLGIAASVQPVFDARWGGPDGMYATRLGRDRVPGVNPFASMLTAGVALALGSDSPVTPFDPWGAVRAAVEHHDERERLAAGAAFDAHTRGGRAAAGDDAGGVLAVGAPATFAVWEVDHVDVGGLPTVTAGASAPRCRMTLRRGTVIHEA
jgi:predicted amidohydrolase YtcJ